MLVRLISSVVIKLIRHMKKVSLHFKISSKCLPPERRLDQMSPIVWTLTFSLFLSKLYPHWLSVSFCIIRMPNSFLLWDFFTSCYFNSPPPPQTFALPCHSFLSSNATSLERLLWPIMLSCFLRLNFLSWGLVSMLLLSQEMPSSRRATLYFCSSEYVRLWAMTSSESDPISMWNSGIDKLLNK